MLEGVHCAPFHASSHMRGSKDLRSLIHGHWLLAKPDKETILIISPLLAMVNRRFRLLAEYHSHRRGEFFEGVVWDSCEGGTNQIDGGHSWDLLHMK